MSLTIKQPWDVPELDLNAYQYKFLAEGDSWFSIGEFPPWATSSLLFGMSRSFAASNLVINCASQGDTLSHMHQMWYDSNFTRMLDAPHLGYYWDALLLSAGGKTPPSASCRRCICCLYRVKAVRAASGFQLAGYEGVDRAHTASYPATPHKIVCLKKFKQN